jgi:hypothetical protein
MAHYAKVVNGIVTKVIVAEEEFFDTFVDSSAGEWIQTSYNTVGGQHPEDRPIRKNFAGVGFTYDAVADAFYAPQPFPSWVLNSSTYLWEAPTARPDGDGDYYWDENSVGWVLIEGDH